MSLIPFPISTAEPNPFISSFSSPFPHHTQNLILYICHLQSLVPFSHHLQPPIPCTTHLPLVPAVWCAGSACGRPAGCSPPLPRRGTGARRYCRESRGDGGGRWWCGARSPHCRWWWWWSPPAGPCNTHIIEWVLGLWGFRGTEIVVDASDVVANVVVNCDGARSGAGDLLCWGLINKEFNCFSAYIVSYCGVLGKTRVKLCTTTIYT